MAFIEQPLRDSGENHDNEDEEGRNTASLAEQRYLESRAGRLRPPPA